MARVARRLAVLVWLPASLASSATFDPDVLIAKLAREPPATIEFAEARFSPLLSEPLVVAGQLSYLGAEGFDRQVEAPYREHTAIRGASVRVEREGEPVRTFALKRAPELGGLLASFVALLSGDAAAVAREFSVVATGDDAAWRLDLTPLDARQRRRLLEIVVSGAGDEPKCFAVLTAQGGGSVMLLGEGAAAAIRADAGLDALLAECRGE
jgi:hypothetical protein